MRNSRKSASGPTRNRNIRPTRALLDSLLLMSEAGSHDNSTHRIDNIKLNFEKLQSCTVQKPCGLVACPVCGDQSVKNRQDAAVVRFRQLTTCQNLIPFSVTIRSAGWSTDINNLQIDKPDMSYAVQQLVTDTNACLYRFDLDSSPVPDDKNKIWNHLHGTVWVNEPSDVTNSSLLAATNQLNVLARQIPVLSSNCPLLDGQVSNLDLTRWAKYQTKGYDARGLSRQTKNQMALQIGTPFEISNLYDRPTSPMMAKLLAAVAEPSGCPYGDQLANRLLVSFANLPKHSKDRAGEVEFAAIKKIVIESASVDVLAFNQRLSLSRNKSDNRRLIANLLILISIVWLSLHESAEHDHLLDLLGQQWPVAKKISRSGMSHLDFWASWRALLTADPDLI
jgi:hypothetical protein